MKAFQKKNSHLNPLLAPIEHCTVGSASNTGDKNPFVQLTKPKQNLAHLLSLCSNLQMTQNSPKFHVYYLISAFVPKGLRTMSRTCLDGPEI